MSRLPAQDSIGFGAVQHQHLRRLDPHLVIYCVAECANKTMQSVGRLNALEWMQLHLQVGLVNAAQPVSVRGGGCTGTTNRVGAGQEYEWSVRTTAGKQQGGKSDTQAKKRRVGNMQMQGAKAKYAGQSGHCMARKDPRASEMQGLQQLQHLRAGRFVMPELLGKSRQLVAGHAVCRQAMDTKESQMLQILFSLQIQQKKEKHENIRLDSEALPR